MGPNIRVSCVRSRAQLETAAVAAKPIPPPCTCFQASREYPGQSGKEEKLACCTAATATDKETGNGRGGEMLLSIEGKRKGSESGEGILTCIGRVIKSLAAVSTAWSACPTVRWGEAGSGSTATPAAQIAAPTPTFTPTWIHPCLHLCKIRAVAIFHYPTHLLSSNGTFHHT